MSRTDTGWHRADILAAVKKRGTSMQALSLASGFAESTLRASMYRRHPKANAAIAAFIGVPVHDLWPHWYRVSGNPLTSTPENAPSAPRSSSQKRRAA